jgi:RNA polymerase sigma-70 factor (ECF subfamily)
MQPIDIAELQQRWPGVVVSPAELGRYLADRRDATFVDDIYLACGCALGKPEAIAVFEAAFRSDVEVVLLRLRLDAPERDEVAQHVRIRLFVGTPPKIAEYAGRSPLGAWVRVVALRCGLNYLRGRRRAAPPDLIAAVQAPRDPCELTSLRGELSAAIQAAFASLSPRQRNLLRQHFVDGATFKDLASAYGVHRVTASLWLKEAHHALIAAIERLLEPRVGDGLASVLDSLGSRLDLSLRAVLRTRPAS